MPRGLTERQGVVLAALSVTPAAQFAPVQIQKLFFLLDENVASSFGGKLFTFEPYDYGPFDKAVYQELEVLKHHGFIGLVQVGPGPGGRRYSATEVGAAVGQEVAATLPKDAVEYIRTASEWVRSLTFAQLVGSIYKAFPAMRARSIFVE
jgi:hypothetical protein